MGRGLFGGGFASASFAHAIEESKTAGRIDDNGARSVFSGGRPMRILVCM